MYRRCFLPQRECVFVIDMISTIEKLLRCNAHVYDSLVYGSLKYKNTAKNENSITVNLEGTVALAYYYRHNEPYPINTVPTELQRERINAIWDAMGHPERKI